MGARALTAYGLGRLAFGAAGLVAPAAVGEALVGEGAREGAARILMGNFATRDVLLGLGVLHAARGGGGEDVRRWLVAGTASDVLDALVQLREWRDLPPDRRVAGVAFSAVAAAGGAMLLLRG
ncbi:MAG TPA: hypothetical protein VF529_03120 [Solirubrobacteraceae bacterium]|jgi:hypothetical protein